MTMLFAKAKKFIAQHRLIDDGDAVVLAVSGGCDSMVLLELCRHLAGAQGLTLHVAHVNHMLRREESDGDESLVRNVTKRYGITYDVLRKRPSAKRNLQEAAREMRMDFLMDVATGHNANSIATAHHQDDQAETILLHLIRGSGMEGLAGIRPLTHSTAPTPRTSVRRRGRRSGSILSMPRPLGRGVEGLTNIGSLKVIRPLLFASRDEIEHYALKYKVRFRNDSTNATTVYMRNSVRHNLMPMLRGYNPRIVSCLCKLAETVAEDRESLCAFANAALSEVLLAFDNSATAITLSGYKTLPPALRKRVLRHAFIRVSGDAIDLNSDQLLHMDQIAMGPKRRGSYRLPAPWKFERNGDIICIRMSGTSCDRSSKVKGEGSKENHR